MNIWECAGTFAFVHDFSDGPVTILKVLAESNFKNTTVCALISMMVVWFYYRMLSLPQLIYETITLCRDSIDWPHHLTYTFGFLMSILCMMHYYWFY